MIKEHCSIMRRQNRNEFTMVSKNPGHGIFQIIISADFYPDQSRVSVYRWTESCGFQFIINRDLTEFYPKRHLDLFEDSLVEVSRKVLEPVLSLFSE